MGFKDLIEEIDVSKKFLLSILLGICIFSLVAHLSYNDWKSLPEEINIPVDQTIERKAREMGINVTQDKDMSYEFSSSRGFGGAGGQGGVVRIVSNISTFLKEADENKKIYFFVKKEWNIVTKQYYFEQTVFIPIYEETYQVSDVAYNIAEFDASNIRVEKTRPAYSAFATYLVASAIVGVVIYVVSYTILWILELIFIKTLWNKIKKEWDKIKKELEPKINE